MVSNWIHSGQAPAGLLSGGDVCSSCYEYANLFQGLLVNTMPLMIR